MIRRDIKRVLLIEDNPADAYLVKKLCDNLELPCEVIVAQDGEEAFTALTSNPEESRQDLPDLILLDLNLPRISGLEVLRLLKGHPLLQAIPVLVLTTSNNQKDVLESYRNGANSFISKPLGLDAMETLLRNTMEFWLNTSTLPNTSLFGEAKPRTSL